MSVPHIATARTAPARPTPSRTHAPLRAVEARPRRSPAVRYALVCVGAMFTIVVAQLLLSIVLTQGAFHLEKLQSSAAQLQREVQMSQVQLQKVSSPQNLASQAAALGMVSDGNPVYLRLSDDAVLGAPGQGAPPAASGNLVPNALVTPPAASATEPGSTAPSRTNAPAGGIAAQSAAPGEAGTGASEPLIQDPLVPWQGELPAPATH